MSICLCLCLYVSLLECQSCSFEFGSACSKGQPSLVWKLLTKRQSEIFHLHWGIIPKYVFNKESSYNVNKINLTGFIL